MHLQRRPSQRSGDEAGSALLASLIIAFTLASLAGALLFLQVEATDESQAAADSARALMLAESGAADMLARFAASSEDSVLEDPSFGIGTEQAPRTMGTGVYWVDLDLSGDVTTITSYGVSGGARRAVEVTMIQPSGGIYANAVYAGNRSEDDSYELSFGGWGSQGDHIIGDIYSGNDVEFWGDALNEDGTTRALGAVSGINGEENVTQEPPDLQAMNYEVANDVDVLQEFQSGAASRRRDAAGGRAWQLPESNPAHIFRLNPSDRKSNYQSTVKHDFFLEDPYEPVTSDSGSNGTNPYRITLSGQDGNPGVDGSDKVYFIDGNLWIHNYKTYSLAFENQAGEDVNVTFVVKGNIYYSDNLFYENPENDSVVFIALKDEAVEDSGNIYFGDPTFGTLERMDAFMYADNDFYDNNLDAAGSAEVAVHGNMTAGNHVDINRDWGSQHSKLTVEFDDRIKEADIDPPGLPDWAGNTGAEVTGDHTITSWREVSAQQ